MTSYLGVEYGCKYVLTMGSHRAVFNDPTDVDFVGVLNPEETSGLDAPEIREDSAERVEDDGAIFGDFFAGKRPVILGGEISATDPVDRNEKVAKLKAASNAKVNNAELTWEPAGLGSQVRVGNLRRQQPARITGGWRKKFQIALVSSDSTIKSVELHVALATGIKLGTVTLAPTSVATEEFKDSSGRVGPVWTSPENAKVSDNVYTTSTPGAKVSGQAQTGWLVSTFKFSEIPAGSRIKTIKVELENKIEAVPTGGVQVFFWFTRIYASLLQTLRVQFDPHGRLASAMPEVAESVDTGGPIDLMEYGTELEGKQLYTRKEITDALRTEGKIGHSYVYDGGAAEVKKISVDQMKLVVTYVTAIVVPATNNGDVPANTFIEVVGPAVNPIIENETTGEILSYSGTIAKGENVLFNSAARTAVSSLYGNVYDNVVFPTNWIKINPGANNITLSAESGTSESETRLSVEWFDTWE